VEGDAVRWAEVLGLLVDAPPGCALVLTTGSGRQVVPAALLDNNGQPLNGLAEVLAVLPDDAVVSRWTVAAWLLTARPDGGRPVDLLADDADRAVAEARDWARSLSTH
jgi:hypothetical protein